MRSQRNSWEALRFLGKWVLAVALSPSLEDSRVPLERGTDRCCVLEASLRAIWPLASAPHTSLRPIRYVLAHTAAAVAATVVRIAPQ